MEYGRLVVLGYSSYRVAAVQAPAPPRSDAGPPSSFGLGVAASAGSQVAANTHTNSPEGPVLGRTGSSSGSGRYSSSRKSLGQLWEPIGDQNAQFVLQRRKRANGVTLRRFHHVRRMGSTDATTAPAASVRSKDTEAVARRMMLAVERLRSEDRTASTNQTDNDVIDADTTVLAVSTTSTASTVSTVSSSNSSRLLADKPFLLCVPMNGSDPHASVTEYTLDPTTDMFQIGRLPCRQNDFVIPGPRVGASGTISRFAARLVCSREPPFQCRVFAGGFDAHRRATTAGHALKYCAQCATWLKKVPLDHACVASARLSSSSRSRSRSRTTAYDDDLEHVELALTDPSDVPIDGVTKNGVRVWLPEHQQWFEVSVNGNLYGIENRSAAGASTRATVRHSTFNRPLSGSDGVPPVLTDGAIIDLGGVQLQFQTQHKLLADDTSESNTNDADTERRTLSSVADQLERLNVQCPVQLHTLRFTHNDADGTALDPLETPHVFPACGHVFGFESRLATSRVCPLCRCPGFLVKLLLKENSQLQSAAERNVIPECVLNPCGHAISRKLAAHYATLVMPNGRAICPFCAAHLHPTTPFSRLFLYSEENETVVR